MKKLFASCQCALFWIILGAGSQAASDRPDPADPAVPVPGVEYRSAFSDYRSYQEQGPLSWKQINEDVARMPGAAGHAGHGGHEAGAKTGHHAEPGPMPAGAIAGTGVIRRIDKVNGKVVIAHEPIAAIGWPAMTMLFRLKDPAIVNPYKEGDRVQFDLEKSASDYVVSGFRKPTGHDRHDAGQGGQK